jgi:hypothetical protein
MRDKLQAVADKYNEEFRAVNVEDPGTNDLCSLADGWTPIERMMAEMASEGGIYNAVEHALDHQRHAFEVQGGGKYLLPVPYGELARAARESDLSSEQWDVVELISEVVYENFGDYFVFADEYDTCAECFGLIRTAPDSYGWRPDFVRDEDGMVYHVDCVSPEDVLEWTRAQAGAQPTALPDSFDPEEYGLSEVPIEYQVGLYGGQRADPQAIVAALGDIPCWFSVQTGQFDARFTVWVPEELAEEANNVLENANTDLPYDPANVMRDALRQVSHEHREGHVTVNTLGVDPDTGEPRVETKFVSNDDFIKGIG